MGLASSKCTGRGGKKLLVPQQKISKLADRSSALSLSGIKCMEVVSKMLVNAQNAESHNSAKVIFTKHLPSSVQLFQFQQCSICQPLGNPVLPVGHNLVWGCCKLCSAKDIGDKNRRKHTRLSVSRPPQSCPTTLAVPLSGQWLSRPTQGCCWAPTMAQAGAGRCSALAQFLQAVVSHGCCALRANRPCMHPGSKASGQPCKIS